MAPLVTPELAISVALFLSCLATCVTSLEQLSVRKELEPFLVVELGPKRNSNLSITKWLLHIRIFASLSVCILIVFGHLPVAMAGVVALSSIALNWIRPVGGDGADQMQLIVILTIAICFLFLEKTLAAQVSSLYIGFQMLLSYTTTGWAKLASPVWRSGNALSGILSTSGYGHPLAGKVLSSRLWVNRLGTWGPMILFSLTPLAFAQPFSVVFVLFLVLAGLFHVGTGVFMGLNNFVISFPAAYPCFLYAYWFVQTGFKSGF